MRMYAISPCATLINNHFPFQRNQCCCTAQVTDRSQCWNDVTTPCPGTMGRRRVRVTAN